MAELISFSSNSVQVDKRVMQWSQIIILCMALCVGVFIHAIKVKFQLACAKNASITGLRAYITAQT